MLLPQPASAADTASESLVTDTNLLRQRLDMGANQFHGKLDPIKDMPYLTELRVDNNRLTGTIPAVLEGPWQVNTLHVTCLDPPACTASGIQGLNLLVGQCASHTAAQCLPCSAHAQAHQLQSTDSDMSWATAVLSLSQPMRLPACVVTL